MDQKEYVKEVYLVQWVVIVVNYNYYTFLEVFNKVFCIVTPSYIKKYLLPTFSSPYRVRLQNGHR